MKKRRKAENESYHTLSEHACKHAAITMQPLHKDLKQIAGHISLIHRHTQLGFLNGNTLYMVIITERP